MAEYIRREDAIKCIEGQCVDGKMWGNDESEGTLIEAYSAIEDLMDIPAADVAPVRHGKWAYYDTYIDGITIFRCTCCGDLQSGRDGWGWKKNYCPNCGCRMDGGAE